jgi:hypothetical protein
MRIAWITLNLVGLALIVGSAIYMPAHKNGNLTLPLFSLGCACSVVSNYFRWRIHRVK